MAKRVMAKPFPKVEKELNVKNIGDMVGAMRASMGLTIRDTAALCGIAVQTLQKIERGDESVRVGLLFNVIRMLGIKLNMDAPKEQEQSFEWYLNC